MELGNGVRHPLIYADEKIEIVLVKEKFGITITTSFFSCVADRESRKNKVPMM